MGKFAEPQPVGSHVAERNGFAVTVAEFAPDRQILEIHGQSRDLVVLQLGNQRQRVEEDAFDAAHSEGACLGQALLRQCFAGRELPLDTQRVGHQPLSFETRPHVAGAFGQRHRAARGAFLHAVVGRAHSQQASPPRGKRATPVVVKRVGHRFHRLERDALLLALALQAQRVFAHDQQPPAPVENFG